MTEEEALRQIPYRCILSSEVIAVKKHTCHTPRGVTTVGIIFFPADVKRKKGAAAQRELERLHRVPRRIRSVGAVARPELLMNS